MQRPFLFLPLLSLSHFFGGLFEIQEDDRDHYGNKRVDLAGPLLASLFRQLFKALVKDATEEFKRVSSLL